MERLLASAKQSLEKKFLNAEAAYRLLAGKLDGLSPLKVLSRGYFRLQAGGKTISSAAQAHVGDEIQATSVDGTIYAEVTKIQTDIKRD